MRTPRVRRFFSGFTLVELLVVIAVLAILIGLLVPSINGVMKSSRVTKSLSQIRSLELAHLAYAEANKGYLADARLPHGGGDQGIGESFVTTLQPYFEQTAAIKSPLDQSPNWSVADGGQGIPVQGSTKRFRKTSYGINDHLATEFSPWGAIDPARLTNRMSRIRNPAATVHTLCMTETGDFAGADHVHVEEWGDSPGAYAIASTQVQTNAAAGKVGAGDAVSPWGFADGHVSTDSFASLYFNASFNHFDPSVSFKPQSSWQKK
ncbi:MAG: type II secretion system GspH family protein [Planctomycetes bacterium]|nr:type II secretion system GspH family protein [Planctomycetota bacterium]